MHLHELTPSAIPDWAHGLSADEYDEPWDEEWGLLDMERKHTGRHARRTRMRR